MPRLVEELVPADAPDPMPDGCPTSGFAVLRFDGGWGDLGPGGAELVEFVVARADCSNASATSRDRRPTLWTGS